MAKKIVIVVAVVFAVVAIGIGAYFLQGREDINSDVVKMRIGNTAITAEVADDPGERERGLSGKGSLKEGEGMLFVFEEPGLYSFWMKDMKFPIDIIWLNSQKQVVHIASNVSPDSYPQSFVSKTSALYVLEVSAGFTGRHNIREGYYVELLTK
ncbi:MAG: DUF192 domain-containing protein [Candidatus Wildermuthbacteria bacterium]|nr:DUF192 domain-containing protein [Candidatus Wildermuthbacteria bacterium]